MATGIQTGTGFRTGTSPTLPTRGGPGPGGGSAFSKLMQSWKSLPPKQKTMYVVIVACVVGMVVLVNLYAKVSADVPLYSQVLSAGDLSEIDNQLTTWKIAHSVSPDGRIMISPRDVTTAKARLSREGLPHRSVGVDTTAAKSGMVPLTKDEKDDLRRQQLEAEMIETLRQVEGVADARVRIVPADDAVFEGDSKPTTASVWLRLKSNTRLSVAQINGLVNLISYSVAGLSPENVKIIDQNGVLLTTEQVLAAGGSGSGNMGAGSSPIKQEAQVALEQELASKVQGMLDKVLGPGKSVVTVTADLDWSQREVSSESVGGPANPEGTVVMSEVRETETFKAPKGSGSEMEQMSLNPSAAGAKGADYRHETVKRNTKTNRTVSRTVSAPGGIRRLTASVMVDNLREDQKAKVAGVVRDAIGFDAARGDSVTVESMPFANPSLLRPELAGGYVPPAVGYKPVPSAATNTRNLYAVALFPMALIMIMAALFLVKQRRVQTEKSRLMLATGPGATVNDISDLLSDKIGKSTPPPATRINSTEQLEKLAKEKPTKVAELLKSTWLAEKER